MPKSAEALAPPSASPEPIRLSARGIAGRAFREFQDDNIPLIAAGITFYTLLSVFPGLAAFAAIYGLFADVGEARQQIQALRAIFPADMVAFLGDQMVLAAAARPQGLSVTIIVGLVLSIWSANGAVSALMLGLNIAYEEKEKRGWLRRTLTSLAFTVGGLVFIVGLLAASIAVVAAYGLGGQDWAKLVEVLRIVALLAGVVAAVSLIYRFGPSRHPAKWRLLGPGALTVTLIWLAATLALSAWLGAMAHYADKYGPVGAVLAFMMWSYVSSVIILAGAEIDAEVSTSEPSAHPR